MATLSKTQPAPCTRPSAGPKKRGSSLAVTAHKVSRVTSQLRDLTAAAKTELVEKHERSAGLRCFTRAFKFLSHDLTQFAVYVVYIYMFQLMSNYLRDSSEQYNSKFLYDVLLEEAFNKVGNPEDNFHGMAVVADIYDWHDNVLWPSLLKDRLPDDSAYLTPTELAEEMDRFDWSAGVSFVQLRANREPASNCGAVEYAAKLNMYREAYTRQGVVFTSAEAQARHSECIPNFDFQMSTLMDNTHRKEAYATVDKSPFGINTTDHQLVPEPFQFYDAAALGANPEGQRSGSVDINFGSIPPGGHASFVIPFFSNKLLPEERGDWTEVTDYRLHAADASITPGYYCVRVSWNGAHIHQACDPNDSAGRTTGFCTDLVRDFWKQMKAARYLDAQTRALTVTLPLRNNNVGLRVRLAMVFQVTSSGSILPSYDIESRKDVFDADGLMRVQMITLVLCVYFICTEVHELYVLGCGYFANMWNLMDWTNFVLYAMLYRGLNMTREALEDTTCSTICQQVGYVDPWLVLSINTATKLYLGILTMIQWIKVIKFINILVPKFSLATSVLSHALADLLLFMLVFMWAIASFAQMFYMQLGPYMRGYSSFFLAIITLMRSLFGDFDIDAILMASNSYVNVVVFMMYLFFAVFILLSIFLTILGEHQEAIESQKRTIRDNEGKLPHNLEWGVFGECKDFVNKQVTSLRTHLHEIQVHLHEDHPKMDHALHRLSGGSFIHHHNEDAPKKPYAGRAKSPMTKMAEAMEEITNAQHAGPTGLLGHLDKAEAAKMESTRRRRGNTLAIKAPAVPLWGFQTHASRLDAVAAQLEREVRECEETFLAQNGRWPSVAEMGKVAASAERLTELTELRETLRAKATELLSGSPADRATGAPSRVGTLGGRKGSARAVASLGGRPNGSNEASPRREGEGSPREGVGPPPLLAGGELPTDDEAVGGSPRSGRVAMRRSPRECPPLEPGPQPPCQSRDPPISRLTSRLHCALSADRRGARGGPSPKHGRCSVPSSPRRDSAAAAADLESTHRRASRSKSLPQGRQDPKAADGEKRRRRTGRTPPGSGQHSEAELEMAGVADKLDKGSCI